MISELGGSRLLMLYHGACSLCSLIESDLHSTGEGLLILIIRPGLDLKIACDHRSVASECECGGGPAVIAAGELTVTPVHGQLVASSDRPRRR